MSQIAVGCDDGLILRPSLAPVTNHGGTAPGNMKSRYR
ncbi:Unknown protein sequence [Pseudomonas syringae pv. maculicola]|nr:Unknown protein sequence [Pseudomonas syringae pv. maculicola]